MADNILRLKVESSEYDAKLKKAAEGIRHLAEVAHKGGGELTGLEKAELDYVKALGEMETKSRSAAGSVRELENTYKELKVVYDQLNDVEKADEGGKALAASLEQIKTRAQEARAQLENASKSLQDNSSAGKESSSVLTQLASKFTINIDALKLFNIGLNAAKGALNVAKDAFFASESNVDEWGRTVRSAEGIYQSFLQSLNTGNFSSFLSNIGQVTQAAREAYNALDELGTRMTIINPERARLQARQQELRADIRRNGADSEAGKAALAELKKIEPLLSKSFKTESQMNYTAFEKLVRERLAEGGINLNQKSFRQFMKTFSNDDAFQTLRRNARGSVTSEMTGNAYNPNATSTRRTVDTRNIEQKLLDLFTDEWRQANSGYLTASFSAQGAAASNALGNARYMKAGGSKGGNGGKTIAEEKDDFTEIIGLIGMAEERVSDLQKRIKEAPDETTITVLRDQLKETQAELDRLNGKELDLDKIFPDQTPQSFGSSLSRGDQMAQQIKANIGFAVQDADMSTLRTLMEATIRNGIEGIDIPSDMLIEQIMGEGLDIPDTYWKKLEDQINEKLKELGVDPISLDLKTGKSSSKGKNTDKTIEKMSKGISGLNSVLGGVEKMGVQLPDEVKTLIGVIEGVMAIIQGVSAIIGVTQTTATTANTVALTALTAAVWANTASSFIPFANGGIVPGYANGGVIDSGHSPSFLSFSKSAPAFATGGIIPKKFATGGIIPKFAGGGMITASHSPAFVSFAKSAASRFASGGTIPHANGGYFVGGTHYSSDVTPIMANAGELILNKVQQNTLAGMLTTNEGIGNLNLIATIKGEQIRLALNNNGRRTGRGEYVQTNRR